MYTHSLSPSCSLYLVLSQHLGELFSSLTRENIIIFHFRNDKTARTTTTTIQNIFNKPKKLSDFILVFGFTRNVFSPFVLLACSALSVLITMIPFFLLSFSFQNLNGILFVLFRSCLFRSVSVYLLCVSVSFVVTSCAHFESKFIIVVE